MTAAAFDRVTAALREHGSRVQPAGDRQAKAQCPAHHDRHESLSVTRGESRVLLRCHAGCDSEAVVKELGLTLADLFDEPRARQDDGDDWMPCQHRKVAEYRYTDEEDRLLFAVARCDRKGHGCQGFRQWHPDPTAKGGRRWNLNGTGRVLYRLPEVTAAIAAGRDVYLAEGEKDVHALEAAGVAATTNPMGAGSWRPEYTAQLAGANVVIVADRDTPGRAHAAKVAAALKDTAASVCVVEPLEGKDAADHLAAGRGVAEFVEVTGEAESDPDDVVETALDAAATFADAVAHEARRMRIREAAQAKLAAEKATHTDYGALYLDRAALRNLPTPEPLIHRILPRHAYVILRGRDHSFKSFVAIDWALCLATGKPWQGHPTEPTRVLYIAGEGAHGLAKRIDAWEYGWGRNIAPEMFTTRQAALNMHAPGPAFDHLLDIVATGRYGFVIIDTLRRVSGAADGNSSEMGLIIDNLDRIKRATHEGSVLAVAHTDKGDHDTRGFSGIEDDADVVWAAKREDMFLTLELAKMKDAADGRQLHLEAQPSGGSLILSGATGVPTANTTQSQAKILTTMRDLFPDGATSTNLRDACGLPRATYHRALADLKKTGHLVNTGSHSRPYYELPALIESHEVPPDDTPSDLGQSHQSQQISLEGLTSLTGLTTLRSETTETNTETNHPQGSPQEPE